MRTERNRLIRTLLYAGFVFVMACTVYFDEPDPRFMVTAAMIIGVPSGFGLMFRKKRTDDPLKSYGRKRSDIVAVIIFDIKCLMAICIGVFAFVPMLISTIKKMPEEKIKCDERVNSKREKGIFVVPG